MATFVDRVVLHVAAGHGGHGCVSVHREKFKPLGGPDGGNGGRGGDVVLEVDASSATLLDFHRRPVRRAGHGRQGEGSNRTGADGTDLIIPVPNGTEGKPSTKPSTAASAKQSAKPQGQAGAQSTATTKTATTKTAATKPATTKAAATKADED